MMDKKEFEEFKKRDFKEKFESILKQRGYEYTQTTLQRWSDSNFWGYDYDEMLKITLQIFLNSDAKNYFESSERLSVMNFLEKTENIDYKLNEDDVILISKIVKKYGKFLN